MARRGAWTVGSIASIASIASTASILAGLAGCAKHDTAPAPRAAVVENRSPAPSCEEAGHAIEAAMTASLAEAKALPVDQRELGAQMIPQLAWMAQVHCDDQGWSASARRCFAGATREPALAPCQKELTPDQRAQAQDVLGRSVMELLASAAGTAVDPDLYTASTGIPACDAYVQASARYARCDRVPVEARDQQRRVLEEMKRGWWIAYQPSLPPEILKFEEDRCQAAADALLQIFKARGCPL